MQNQDLERLRSKLMESKQWPQKYMFKFIVPNSDNKVDQIVALLPQNGKNSFKHTKSLKYVSVTCVASMPNADAIIDITAEITKIEGILSL